LKTIFITLFKVTALAMIVASFFLALTNRYGESQWDPIQEIQQLKNQNRRDDAIDLVNFLKENQTHETDDLHKIEKEVAYSPLEWAKAFVWDGVVKGNVNDTYSGIGALAADFCLYGDIFRVDRMAGINYRQNIQTKTNRKETILMINQLILTGKAGLSIQRYCCALPVQFSEPIL
jgi:hypothetical protein